MHLHKLSPRPALEGLGIQPASDKDRLACQRAHASRSSKLCQWLREPHRRWMILALEHGESAQGIRKDHLAAGACRPALRNASSPPRGIPQSTPLRYATHLARDEDA